MFIILKNYYFQLWFLFKSDLLISTAGKQEELSELNTFKPRQEQYLLFYWSDKGFKGTVVNLTLQSLHGTLNYS